MEKTLKKDVPVGEHLHPKTVDIFINPQMFSIAGNWQWDMQCDAVFCSDVIIMSPPDTMSTKGIIHPDDVEYVRQSVAALETAENIPLDFRIITTYGEVKKLTGKNCWRISTNDLNGLNPERDLLKRIEKEQENTKTTEAFTQLKEITDHAEKITKSGTWYMNSISNETFYSDNVFRIHGVMPQSLNPHFNTFSSFIHPDDRQAVNDTFDNAYRDVFPLHLWYRIITANEQEKYISLTTHWNHNSKGELILNGFMQDTTDLRASDGKLEETENELKFHKQLLQINDKSGNIAFWYTNLLTRQTYYSDNYYRIHGLKPQSIPPAANIFNNYVHPDDRQKVLSAFQKIRKEHAAPDIDYRIIRADKKIRYIRQTGELVTYGGELIMTGTIRDLTSEKVADKKLHELNEELLMKEMAYLQTEEATGISNWLLNLETGITTWSDNIYNLLGYKKTVRELSQKEMLRSILPEDRKRFSDELAMTQEQGGERKFEFRILKTGEVRYIQGFFRLTRDHITRILIATFKDITDEHLLQQQLFESIQLNHLLTENIVDRIFITDVHNNIVLWNRKCENFFELRKDQVTGRNYFDVFPQFKTDEIITRFNKVGQGDIVHEVNERSSLKKFHDLHMIPLKSKDNSMIGILHVQHDVTKELELVRTLNERVNFIEKLLEETVDRIIVLDKNLNFLYWNKTAEQHYHINKEYVIGKNLAEVFPSLINEPLYPEIRKALKGETVYVPLQRNGDKNECEETYLIPLVTGRKEVTSVLWIVHDLTREVEKVASLTPKNKK